MQQNLFFKIALVAVIILNCFVESFAQDNSNILWSTRWSNDNKFIGVGGSNEHLRIYSTDSFKVYRSFYHQGGIYRMEWHPTKNILAVGGGQNSTRLIDLDNHKVINLKNVEGGTRAIGWSRNGKYIACGDFEGNLIIWNEAGELVRIIKKENTFTCTGLDWHPKKDEIIVVSKHVRVYDLEGNLLEKFAHREKEVLTLCVQWHPSGKFFVIGDYGDNQKNYPALLQFWNKKYKLKSAKEISKAEYRNIRWNRNGTQLATASEELRIWSKKGKLLFEGKSEQLLWGIDWSSDGEYIVTSSELGQFIIWNNQAEIVKKLE